MGTWDYYSFANDTVIDLIDLSVHDRGPMIVSTDIKTEDMPLRQVIDTYYSLEFENAREVMYKALEESGYEIISAGIVLLFVGNHYEQVPNLIIALAIEWLSFKYIGQLIFPFV